MDEKKDFFDDFQLNIDEELLNNTVPEVDAINTEFTQDIRLNDDKEESKEYYRDEDKRKKRKEHRKRNKIKAIKNRRVFRFVWFAMVILVGLSIASYLNIGSNDLFAVGRIEGQAEINIEKDMTASQLATLLEESGVISSAQFFQLYCSVTTDMKYFREGSHTVPTNLDYEELINELQSSAPLEIVENVLFVEGLTIYEVATILEENGVCSYDDVLEAANSDYFDIYDMIGYIDNEEDKYYKLEGYLFPDKYDFYVGEDVHNALGKLLNNFQSKITADMMEDVEASGYSLDEIITLASIIQAEAADKIDMYRVSAVLHNRLENGASADIYSLGLDSTLYYPYSKVEQVPEGFTSKYNTYKLSGLPAGAINSPGVDAINAALNPDPEYSKMFYFCHDSEGNAYYAKTAAEHQKNVDKLG